MQYILIGLCCAGIGIFYFFQAKKIKYQKQKDFSAYQNTINNLEQKISKLEQKREQIRTEIYEVRHQLDSEYQQEKIKIDEQLQLYKQVTNNASQQYFTTLDQHYLQIEAKYDKAIANLQAQLNIAENKLQQLKNSLAAGVQARLREQETKEQINFYKIVLSSEELQDIQELLKLKSIFHQPDILNKLIWTTYLQKKVSEMCNRILGTGKICGIYKITNLDTQQCYVGQSLDISTRWKVHCKCGCGIGASTTNRLYQDMIKTGIWNFSFELLEECEKTQLNEKEKFWIEMYQSNKFGLNSTKGNNT